MNFERDTSKIDCWNPELVGPEKVPEEASNYVAVEEDKKHPENNLVESLHLLRLVDLSDLLQKFTDSGDLE